MRRSQAYGVSSLDFHCGNDLEYFKARLPKQHVAKPHAELSTFDQCVECI